MDFSVLNTQNYVMYAMRNYDNPQCVGMSEFTEDLHRIKYLKRLFRRFLDTGELKERLILNHLITFYNVFGIEAATRLIFYRMNEEYYPLVKTFLVFLNLFPEGVEAEAEIKEADLISISLNENIISTLRSI
ncbi:MAG: hypothetical protein HOJ16_08730 [Candidatus Peribacter sp.]|nr:hypothetical protein [Candidatus Peribacter sp.]